MAAAATLVSSHRHRSPPQTTVARPPSPSAHTIPCAPTADDPTVSGPLLLPTPDNSNVVAQGQRVRRRAERLLVHDDGRGGQVCRALQRQEHRPQGLALSTASVDQAKDEQQGRRTRRGHRSSRPLFIYISDGGEQQQR
ncbi:uncharacterized protein [Zea mays]|uniref:Uncharacterized protein n=1 Tax=Zea mays TaxID=4577 RepID=C0P3E5_MAIZE|nr:uncharacterized protein LOC111591184 [Zea mays]ACN27511.1 unknown [Zea mays]|eukprot:XP_023157897.1 uncharacterized protein LOC111591184 [Zea mays]